MAGELAERVIAAHGGRALWEDTEEIRVQVSAGGPAFATKLQGRAVRDVEARVSTREQRVTFSPYPKPGHRGVLDPDGSIRIELESGELVSRRDCARETIARPRHRLWWDSLDMLYFGTYAIWTYISVPFVLVRPEYEVRELDPWQEQGETWRRLHVRFPAHVHTHSREQVFYFDERDLIRRHDYTAEPLSRRAHAAHYCLEHREFDGLTIPTRRRVYPRRRDNRRRAGPLLVWIELPRAHVG